MRTELPGVLEEAARGGAPPPAAQARPRGSLWDSGPPSAWPPARPTPRADCGPAAEFPAHVASLPT